MTVSHIITMKLRSHASTCTFALVLSVCCALSLAQYPTVPDVTVAKGYVAELWVAKLPRIRTLIYDSKYDVVLGLVRVSDSVVAFKENKEGTSVTQTTLIDNSTLGLNHGLALLGGYLYASSPTTVYRWPYKAADKPITDPYEVVVKGIPSVQKENGNTRSLLVDGDKMYVSIGTNLNVQADPNRAKVVYFNLANKVPTGGWSWSEGKNYSTGLRNTVGMAVDDRGRLWGAECGADQLTRADLGAKLDQDNPAEEINLLEDGGAYGFPWCFTAWNIPNTTAPGNNRAMEQLTWPSVSPDFTQKYTDAWCNERANNRAPAGALPGHSVPIGFTFYDGKGCREKGGFDCFMKNDAFIAMRGSATKDVPNGFQVARMKFVDGKPADDPAEMLIQHTDYQKNCFEDAQKAKCFRPTSVLFLPSGKLLIAADINDGYIVRLSRDSEVPIKSDKAGGGAGSVKGSALLWAMLSAAALVASVLAA